MLRQWMYRSWLQHPELGLFSGLAAVMVVLVSLGFLSY